jgi:HSP20 family molecular chaperone IbpA
MHTRFCAGYICNHTIIVQIIYKNEEIWDILMAHGLHTKKANVRWIMMTTVRKKLEPDVYTSFDDTMTRMIVEILLPGVEPDMIKLKVFNECLLLFARNGETHFSKIMNFIMPVEADKAKALLGNGILRIIVPLKGG